MKDFRLGKNTTEHYTSFKDLANGWHVKGHTSQTKDKEKLERQRTDFCKRHTCKVCNQPMKVITGVSIDGENALMCCTNPECKGIPYKKTDSETGEKRTCYAPYQIYLKEKGAEIAFNLFSE